MPGLTRRLVRGADLVPDHVGDDRRPAIRYHYDFKAIGELEIAGVDARRRTAALG